LKTKTKKDGTPLTEKDAAYGDMAYGKGYGDKILRFANDSGIK